MFIAINVLLMLHTSQFFEKVADKQKLRIILL